MVSGTLLLALQSAIVLVGTGIKLPARPYWLTSKIPLFFNCDLKCKLLHAVFQVKSLLSDRNTILTSYLSLRTESLCQNWGWDNGLLLSE